MNKEILETLDKIVPVVARVHKDNHPELGEVEKLYNKVKDNPSGEVFERLREVTKNYEIPADACPTYTKTYELLAALEKELG